MLLFEIGKQAPQRMSRPIDPVVHQDIAYLRRFRTRVIYKYNSQSGRWSTLPECPVQDTALAILPIHNKDEIKYTLHTVGGYLRDPHNTVTGALYYLSERPTANRDGTEYYWDESLFPPMNVARKQVTVVCDRDHKYMIAAGGRGKHRPMKTVEILNLGTKEWLTVVSLPQAVFRASGCISEGYLYIAGGCIYDKTSNQIETKKVFRILFSKLVNGGKGEFEKAADLPHERSVCTAFQDRLFAIGGTKNIGDDDAVSINHVYLYLSKNKSWQRVPNSLCINRCYCFAFSFTYPKPQLMVVGGYTGRHDEGCTSSVEIATLSV